jgi:putative ABC transport system permease protein
VTAASPDFTLSSQQSLVETATNTEHILTVLLGGIAAISLLVGGIGVMNIMLVSVAERVREIGLRKALGATPSVILRQFLLEASLLGLTGGILGLAVGYAGAAILPNLLSQPSPSPPCPRWAPSWCPSRSAWPPACTRPSVPPASPPSTPFAANDESDPELP